MGNPDTTVSPGLNPLGQRPGTITDMVLESLKSAIVDKSLEPGMHVSEALLAGMLNVSKTPVREALLRLRHIGLIESVRGQLRVVLPSEQAIRNSYEIRAGLEWQSTRLAAQRATGAARAHLTAIAEESFAAAENSDPASFRTADRTLHRAIADASSNSMLADSVEDSLLLTSALRERDVPATGDSVQCGREHVAITRAIEAGNAEEAAAVMASHVLHVMDMVLAARQT